MKWSDELPKVPGWWWFRSSKKSVFKDILEVEERFGQLNVFKGASKPIMPDGQWAGPIPEPEE